MSFNLLSLKSLSISSFVNTPANTGSDTHDKIELFKLFHAACVDVARKISAEPDTLQRLVTTGFDKGTLLPVLECLTTQIFLKALNVKN